MASEEAILGRDLIEKRNNTVNHKKTIILSHPQNDGFFSWVNF